MTYPDAPWKIKGYGYQTIHLIDTTEAAKYIPIDLEIVSVLPGKTLGGVFIAKYEADSTLHYSELIVIPGIVRHGSKIGAWVSHIYVDNPDSISGGREIWGLPKEYAEFAWQSTEQGGVIVRQSDRVLCRFSHGWQFSLWQMRGGVSTFSHLEPNLLLFDAHAVGNLALVGARLEVPVSSPFANLIDHQLILAVKAEGLDITVSAPSAIAPKIQVPTKIPSIR